MSASGKPGASDKGGGTGTEKRRRFGPEQHGPKPRHYRKQHLHAQQ